MTPQKGKQPQDIGIFIGGGVIGFGVLTGFIGVSGLCAIFATGVAGFTAAVTALAHIGIAAAGLYMVVKGAVTMGRGFTQAGKTRAEIAFEENPEPFMLRHITTPQPDFNPKAQRDVKVMRPLKIAPKNKALDLPPR